LSSQHHTGARKLRARTTPAVAPVTRAIRAALALSSTMLALSAPAWAASTCSYYAEVARTGYVCDGGLVQAGQDPASPAPDDLTRVRGGEQGPASVIPAVGTAGWADDVSPFHPGSLDDADAASIASWDAGTVDDVTVVSGASGIGAAPATQYLAIDNSIDVSAIVSTGDVTSYGAVSSSYLINDADGIIDATASTMDGNALAVGALVAASDVATLTNYGDISALATSASNGDAQAYAAVASGSYVGIGLLINGGDLSAVASAGAGGHAYATGAYVYANVASIFNDANSSAMATAGDGGMAVARGARAYGEYTAVSNYGALTATASADGGTAMARGADSLGYLGSSVYNAGDIQAVANADGGAATAMGSYSLGQVYSSYTTNTGTITADASGASADALGVLNAALYIGDAITINDGSISAVAEGTVAPYGVEEAVAIGVYNFATYYSSVVDNSGSISATALATADISGTDGFLQAKALGVQALAAHGYGETTIVNTGDIHASADTSQGYASAWGAIAQAGLYGSVAIENDGLIASYAHADIGVGMTIGAYTLSIAGTSQVVNHGDIVATARAERGIVNVTVDYADATGVQVVSVPYGAGEAIVDNYGNIQANTHILGGIGYATGVQAYGQYMTLYNAAGANITATVDAELFGGAFATAVEAGGKLGADIVNDGTITAYGHANAYSEGENGFYGAAGATGIYVNASYQGNAMVVNNGDINAIAIAENSVSWAQGGAGATGVHVYAKYDASIVNAGDINAIADAQFGNVSAYGAAIHGKYSGQIVNQAGASIVASASVGSLAGDQSAGHAASFGTQIFGSGMEDAGIYNAGSIVSHAVVTPDGTGTAIGSIAQAWGSSIGYNSSILRGEVDNVGSIEAFAGADFGYASAYGAFVTTRYDAAITNAGDIHSTASATGGNAFAVGSYANAVHQTVSYNCDADGCDYANPIIDVDAGNSLIDNSGDIIAMASAQGGIGYSYGAVALGGLTAGIVNTGHISARTDADDALAVGTLLNGFYGDAQLHNSGTIVAMATGDIANATGAGVHGYNGVVVDNSGTIIAGAYGADATATAISMESNGSNVLTNTGTIAAFGDGERIAIASGTGATSIANSGSIVGAIRTAAGGSLDNAVGASWHAVGESDFGTDGSIVNAGTIFMDDAAILMGGDTYTPANVGTLAVGNTFDNSGTFSVSGSGNILDTGMAYNNGVISFVDGEPDDVLTITGDFSGDGVINLDVSGLNQSSDQLYVEGNVIETTTQTLNVNLTDLPSTPHTDVPLITSSGTLAGDFVLGNLRFAQDGFVTMDFGLNVSGDKVSLGVDVTGLNSVGTMAAVVAPGMQSLVNAQVGTMRQRMGVIPEAGNAGVAPWMRVFADSGSVAAQHSANFTTDSDLGFHQSNHGWEVGVDTRPSEHLAFGALIAKSDGSQSVDGAGSDRFDGRTFGLYATWLGSNGLYVDASQRWTGIDARVRSATGTYTTKGSAQTFNLEAGFTAWTTAGGLNVVPQAQYTHTRLGDIRALHGSQAEFADEGGVSSRGRLGVSFDKVFQGATFTWTPYGSISAVHEFDGGYDYAVNDGLQGTTSTDGTSAMVEFGLGARRDKLAITGGVNWMDGGAVESVKGGQLTLRYTW
jgi:outer membrane autotransporter protein